MEFIDIVGNVNHEDTLGQIYGKTSADVEIALSKQKCSLSDFMALISPAATPYLEHMAQESLRRTRKRFGKTIQMYVPLYLSNYCTNHCVYCGFNHNNEITRTILSADNIRTEAEAIRSMGFEHILLVTGESPKCGASYLKEAIELLRPLFSQISVEVQPLKQDEYELLIDSGLHAVYLYQETYNSVKYKDYHPRGMKANYAYRLDTFERMGRAGIHKMGLGVLLGLDDWRLDSFYLALHLDYLRKKYWRTKYSVSFPRLRPHAGSFNPPFHATERDLLQLICAYRIFDQDLELALSTRECPHFRDNAMQLGITAMSAGSHTEPGGYASDNGALKQFEPNDNRSPQEVMNMIKSQGYETVWKDWDAYMQLSQTH
jgi:2-iminoacetate synthase